MTDNHTQVVVRSCAGHTINKGDQINPNGIHQMHKTLNSLDDFFKLKDMFDLFSFK